MEWLFSGADISARYFLKKTAHWAGVSASWASFMVSRLGARLGNHTSYQFCDANSDFGTPRGGRRTVPMRVPSFATLWLPSLTTRTTIFRSLFYTAPPVSTIKNSDACGFLLTTMIHGHPRKIVSLHMHNSAASSKCLFGERPCLAARAL